MRKYNIKRDIAYYEGMMAGYHLLKQLMLGCINREIFSISEKIDYLKKELENEQRTDISINHASMFNNMLYCCVLNMVER